MSVFPYLNVEIVGGLLHFSDFSPVQIWMRVVLPSKRVSKLTNQNPGEKEKEGFVK